MAAVVVVSRRKFFSATKVDVAPYLYLSSYLTSMMKDNTLTLFDRLRRTYLGKWRRFLNMYNDSKGGTAAIFCKGVPTHCTLYTVRRMVYGHFRITSELF